MLLSALSKFVASLTVSALCIAIITGVLSTTLLSYHFIEGELAKTNSYSKISDAIVKQVAKNNDSSDPDFQTKLQAVVTPAYVQQKIDGGLVQAQDYFFGKGQPPSIDLSDFTARAQAAGIPINSGGDNNFNKPITLTDSNNLQGDGNLYWHVELGTIIGSAVLIVLLLALSWERHRYAAVPDVLIVVGVLIGLLATLFLAGPGVAEHFAKVNFNSNDFTTIGHDLGVQITHDVGLRFAIIAGLCFVFGVVARIWLGKKKLTGVSSRQKFVADFGAKPSTKPAAKPASKTAPKSVTKR